MDLQKVISTLDQFKIIPVIAIDNEDDALPLADALHAGGLGLAEITFRTKAAPAVIKSIAKERPEIYLGAGTVLTPDQLQEASDCGAQFAVAPGFNPKVVEKAMKMDFPFFPGIMTPSDIEGAFDMGVTIFKYFPAEAAGGLKMLKNIAAPYLHLGIKFIPTGGINIDNMNDYLSQPMIAAVGGTWIAKQNMILDKKWTEIEEICKVAKGKL